MNKHKRALINLLIFVAALFHTVVLPSYIVEYGMANKIPAFDNGSPFSEVYSAFCAFWVFAHLIGGVLLLSLYMITYGCHKGAK